MPPEDSQDARDERRRPGKAYSGRGASRQQRCQPSDAQRAITPLFHKSGMGRLFRDRQRVKTSHPREDPPLALLHLLRRLQQSLVVSGNALIGRLDAAPQTHWHKFALNHCTP
jgi:hypothetical protein